MGGMASSRSRSGSGRGGGGTSDPWWARVILTGVAFGFLGIFLLLPLVNVFGQAFSGGPGTSRGAAVGDRPSAAPPRGAGDVMGCVDASGYAVGDGADFGGIGLLCSFERGFWGGGELGDYEV